MIVQIFRRVGPAAVRLLLIPGICEAFFDGGAGHRSFWDACHFRLRPGLHSQSCRTCPRHSVHVRGATEEARPRKSPYPPQSLPQPLSTVQLFTPQPKESLTTCMARRHDNDSPNALKVLPRQDSVLTLTRGLTSLPSCLSGYTYIPAAQMLVSLHA